MKTNLFYLLALVLVLAGCESNVVSDVAIKTATISSVNSYSALCGGEILSGKNVSVLSRGVCWSLKPYPVYTDQHSIDSLGSGKFTSKITQLNADSTYYVRAYCITKNDTVYGNQVTFKTSNGILFNPNITYGTVTDIDGNVYKTVTIGTQTWMAENLKVTRYRNGDPIANETDLNKWGYFQIKTGAYCWYNNNTSNKNIYGALYNWYAASDTRNIAPEGWHVAGKEDWEIIQTYMAKYNQTAVKGGNRLNEATSAHWKNLSDAQVNNNETGFTAMPAGRATVLGFMGVGSNYAFFWTKTGTADGSSCVYLGSDITIDNMQPNCNGYSIRCVKD